MTKLVAGLLVRFAPAMWFLLDADTGLGCLQNTPDLHSDAISARDFKGRSVVREEVTKPNKAECEYVELYP